MSLECRESDNQFSSGAAAALAAQEAVGAQQALPCVPWVQPTQAPAPAVSGKEVKAWQSCVCLCRAVSGADYLSLLWSQCVCPRIGPHAGAAVPVALPSAASVLIWHLCFSLSAPTFRMEPVTTLGVLSLVLNIMCAALNLVRGVHLAEHSLQVARAFHACYGGGGTSAKLLCTTFTVPVLCGPGA